MVRWRSHVSLRRSVFFVVALLLLMHLFQEPVNTMARRNNRHFCSQDFDLDILDYREDVPNELKPRILGPNLNSTYSSRRHRKCIDQILHQTVKVSKLGTSSPLEIPGREYMHYGSYIPTDCQPRQSVAIIIPLRGREKYLHHLLSHMHPIWRRQGIEYAVFVTTQTYGSQFNKAKLMNAGFHEARKHGHYDCFVFHDVDALLEDDRCLYWCDQENPRHLCAHADVFNYKEVWYYSSCRPPQSLFTAIRLFGGVTMFTAEQFIRINGFSNYYWGWGGEDDDMYKRLKNKGYEVVNPYGRYCSYTLLQHPHETLNAPTRAKESLVYHSTSRQDKDGLKNVRYKVVSYEYNPLFVNITVDVGRPSKRMQDFIDESKKLWFFNQCIVRMPWNL